MNICYLYNEPVCSMVVPEELILTVIRSPNGFIKVNFQTIVQLLLGLCLVML